MSAPWHAVDGGGRALATGRPPEPPGWPSPAAALAAAPVGAWPVFVAGSHGRRLALAEALGPGGDRVERLLETLAGGMPGDGDVEALARDSPAGALELPVDVVPLRDAVDAAAAVDAAWLAAADRAREGLRRELTAAGRELETEAALHVSMLLVTEWLDPADDEDVDAHVASGAQLWLLTGAVVSALADAAPDPFASWGRLVAAGWWPVGPVDARVVVTRPRG